MKRLGSRVENLEKTVVAPRSFQIIRTILCPGASGVWREDVICVHTPGETFTRREGESHTQFFERVDQISKGAAK